MRIFSRIYIKSFVLVLAVVALGMHVSMAFGAELHVPEVAGNQGEVVTLDVIVDKVDNLSGIKLVLTYDRNILKFVKAEKSVYTANMLNVVNDKTPGKLILVMAAARGFAGENAVLIELSFELLKDVKKADNVTLQIIEAELMSDDLKRIDVKFN